MTEQTLGDALKPLWERDLRGIEKQTTRLQERYQRARDQVKKVAAIVGIDETDLVTVCVETVRNRRDMGWLDVLDILDFFYTSKRRMDSEKAGEEKER